MRSYDAIRIYESWLNGNPEVVATLSYLQPNGQGKNEVTRWMFREELKTSWVEDRRILDIWDEYAMANMMTLALVEEDGGESGSWTIGLSSEVKTPKVFGFEILLKPSVSYTSPKKNRDDIIGSGFVYFRSDKNGATVTCGSNCSVIVKSEN